MEAARVQFGSIVEWLVAAAVIVVLVAAGSSAVREASTVTPVTPVIAREVAAPASALPAGVPSGAVSLPVLLLPDGQSVRVGDTLPDIAVRLGRRAEVGVDTVDHTPPGERLVRLYEHAGTEFILVFEPLAEAEPRVTAIYRP